MNRSRAYTPFSTRKIFAILLCTSSIILITLVVARWRLHTLSQWIWLSGFLLSFFIRIPHAKKHHQLEKEHYLASPVDRISTALMFLCMMFLPLIYLSTSWLDFANYAAPTWTVWVGSVCYIFYLWLFWRSHRDLQNNWSPVLEIQEGHTLVTHGVYRKIRHPIYASIWLGCFAQALLLHNLIAGLLVLPAFLLMYITRVPKEEAMMAKQFGRE